MHRLRRQHEKLMKRARRQIPNSGGGYSFAGHDSPAKRRRPGDKFVKRHITAMSAAYPAQLPEMSDASLLKLRHRAAMRGKASGATSASCIPFA